jgi:hypothetical protein
MPTPELANADDVSRIVEIFQACFADEYFTQLFPHTESGTSYLRDAWDWFLREESATVYVIRDEQGKIKAVQECCSKSHSHCY